MTSAGIVVWRSVVARAAESGAITDAEIAQVAYLHGYGRAGVRRMMRTWVEWHWLSDGADGRHTVTDLGRDAAASKMVRV